MEYKPHPTCNPYEPELAAGQRTETPEAKVTIGACRAYFQLNEELRVNDASGVRIVLHFDGAEASGIHTHLSPAGVTADEASSWFTINGTRLPHKPTTKGIYVNGGRKVVIH